MYMSEETDVHVKGDTCTHKKDPLVPRTGEELERCQNRHIYTYICQKRRMCISKETFLQRHTDAHTHSTIVLLTTQPPRQRTLASALHTRTKKSRMYISKETCFEKHTNVHAHITIVFLTKQPHLGRTLAPALHTRTKKSRMYIYKRNVFRETHTLP